MLGAQGYGVTDAFQSTHPRGVRPRLLSIVLIGQTVSIHAPAWGATDPSDQLETEAEFQSTHPRGVRLVVDADFEDQAEVSIHAPAWGATGSWIWATG